MVFSSRFFSECSVQKLKGVQTHDNHGLEVCKRHRPQGRFSKWHRYAAVWVSLDFKRRY
jgi:hypothetical protein